MKKLKNSHIITFSVFLSLLVHLSFLILKGNKIVEIKQTNFHVPKIRIVGEETGKKERLIFVKQPTPKHKNNNKKSNPSLKDLSFSEFPIQQKALNVKAKEKKLTKLEINKKAIKRFLQTSRPGGIQSASQALKTLSDPINDVNIQLEVPKGIKEDELNKHELVYYSFQKRTVMAYVNSFHKELNSFEKSNPHLRFPLTRQKQSLAGRVIYDQNGDILRIETLKYTNISKLQDFFMNVLKNMNSLPNPPKEILENDQFAINFILSLNN